MNCYLAARYSRRLELCGYRDDLTRLGHTVTSRWLNGSHQIADDGKPIGDAGEALVEGDDGSTSGRAESLRRMFAYEDLCDLLDADTVISFTEPPRSTASRGGRHVEFGIALGINEFWKRHVGEQQRRRLIVVGYRENVFHWLPRIEFAESWEKCLELLR